MNAKKKLTLGQRLRRERMNLNWSQDQLATEIGTSALSINRAEDMLLLKQINEKESQIRAEDGATIRPQWPV